jgi:hypothetical protein
MTLLFCWVPLRQIVRDLEPTITSSNFQLEASGAIQFAADRAILAGLIITGAPGSVINNRKVAPQAALAEPR